MPPLDAEHMYTGMTISGGLPKTVFRNGTIEAPVGLRSLIEAVHGPNSEDLPEIIEQKLQEAEGAVFAEAAHAQFNVVKPEDGYLNGIRGEYGVTRDFPLV